EDFPELIWDKMEVDGQLLDIALDSHPFVLYYNSDIAEAAGGLASDRLLLPTATPGDFRDLPLDLSCPAPSGSCLPRRSRRGTTELPEGGSTQYQEEIAIDASEWILSLIDGEAGNPSHDGGTAISEFATGGSGAFFGGVWEIGSYRNEGVPFDMTMVPGVFG